MENARQTINSRKIIIFLAYLYLRNYRGVAASFAGIKVGGDDGRGFRGNLHGFSCPGGGFR